MIAFKVDAGAREYLGAERGGYAAPSKSGTRLCATPWIRSNGGASELHVEGAFDAVTIEDINEVIESVVAEHPRQVTVDLDDVSLLDSFGVRAIVTLWKRIKAQGGSVVVVHAHDQPLTVLKVLKLDVLFGTSQAANGNAT